jgi:hypothetical protein
MKMDLSARRGERGNVIFYIFIAIALLGALSFAVSQSNQGNVTALSNERARLLASELIDYSNAVAEAVGRLRLNGVAETSLCFDASEWPAGAAYDYNHAGCSTESNQIFSIKGGGVQFKPVTAEILEPAYVTTNYWVFNAEVALKDIGTHGTSDDNVDLVMYVLGVQDSVCKQVNDLLGFADASSALPSDTGFGTSPFTDAYSYSAQTGTSLIAGKKAACYYDSAATDNVYYRVLLAR